jgi:hypothetical protein
VNKKTFAPDESEIFLIENGCDNVVLNRGTSMKPLLPAERIYVSDIMNKFLEKKTAPGGGQLELLVRRLPSEKQIEKEALKRCTEISMNYVHPINKKWFIKGARWVKDWIRQSA